MPTRPGVGRFLEIVQFLEHPIHQLGVALPRLFKLPDALAQALAFRL
jgi:hypothetical protein